jgi:hypothetical protein
MNASPPIIRTGTRATTPKKKRWAPTPTDNTKKKEICMSDNNQINPNRKDDMKSNKNNNNRQNQNNDRNLNVQKKSDIKNDR